MKFRGGVVRRKFPATALLVRRIDIRAAARPLSRKFEQLRLLLRWGMRTAGRRGHLLFTDHYTSTWPKCPTSHESWDGLATMTTVLRHSASWFLRAPRFAGVSVFDLAWIRDSSRMNNLRARHWGSTGSASETCISTIDVLSGNSHSIEMRDIKQNNEIITKRYFNKLQIYKKMFNMRDNT